VLSAAGCARPLGIGQSLTALPYQVEPSGRIVVDVIVNEQGPFRFAIDTAATGSFAFSRMIDELSVETVPEITITVYGAVATGTFPAVDLESLQVGGEVWSDVRLTALPGNTSATATLDGVLGADFLRRYSVGFSVQDRTIYLFDPQSIGNRSYRGWTQIAITARRFGASLGSLRYLEMELEGRSVPALLDLGAGISILNSAAARVLRLAASRASQEAELAGAIGTAPVFARLSSQEIHTGPISWRDESFLIADLEIFETLQSADTPLAILGSGLFTQRDFIIDFARERLLVRTSMSETAPP
jgi:predicted aspartyl protease